MVPGLARPLCKVDVKVHEAFHNKTTTKTTRSWVMMVMPLIPAEAERSRSSSPKLQRERTPCSNQPNPQTRNETKQNPRRRCPDLPHWLMHCGNFISLKLASSHGKFPLPPKRAFSQRMCPRGQIEPVALFFRVRSLLQILSAVLSPSLPLTSKDTGQDRRCHVLQRATTHHLVDTKV